MRKILALILALTLLSGSVFARIGYGRKIVVGDKVHFTITNDEEKEFYIQLFPDTYTIFCDIKRLDENPKRAMKVVVTQGLDNAVIDSSFLQVNQPDLTQRVGRTFESSKPSTSRFRFHNLDAPLEIWMTIVPKSTMKWVPFAFDRVEPKPLEIGYSKGKGGTLGPHESAYQYINLIPGSWTFSLNLRRADGRSSALLGKLEEFDHYGFKIGDLVEVREVGSEVRRKGYVDLIEYTNPIFIRVTNLDSDPVDYMILVEKGRK